MAVCRIGSLNDTRPICVCLLDSYLGPCYRRNASSLRTTSIPSHLPPVASFSKFRCRCPTVRHTFLARWLQALASVHAIGSSSDLLLPRVSSRTSWMQCTGAWIASYAMLPELSSNDGCLGRALPPKSSSGASPPRPLLAWQSYCTQCKQT